MSTWIYGGEDPLDEKFKTWSDLHKEKWLYGRNDPLTKIQGNDTIFVSYIKMQEFTRNFLPFIEEEFVLITEGSYLIGFLVLLVISSRIPNFFNGLTTTLGTTRVDTKGIPK